MTVQIRGKKEELSRYISKGTRKKELYKVVTRSFLVKSAML